jgi:leucyl-tRNA synthetase
VQPDALNDAQKDLRRKLHQTIEKISDDIGRRHAFNTAVAAAMELLNAIGRFDDTSAAGRAVEREALNAVVLMLSPIVPHICDALWRALGNTTLLVDAPWPSVDAAALRRSEVDIVVQVNGKLRGKITVAADASKAKIIEAALADRNVQRFVAGNAIQKTIVVPGRLVNVVV